MHYNMLPSVEQANDALSAVGTLPSCFDALVTFSRNNNIVGELGMFLIHRHLCIDEGEIVVEFPSRDENGREMLVSKIREQLSADRPASWILSDNGTPKPFEWVVDGAHADRLRQQGHIMSALEIVAEHGLADTMAVGSAIRTKKSYEYVDMMYVEEINEFEKTHILRLRKSSEFDGEELITTRWPIGKHDFETMNCRPSTGCLPTSSCVPRSPGHSIERGHRSVPTHGI